MKAHDNGCFFSVTIERKDIEAFRPTWPCSGLGFDPIWAQFDKKNGDLVDIRHSHEYADEYALAALIEDGQNYAAKRLGLPGVCYRNAGVAD